MYQIKAKNKKILNEKKEIKRRVGRIHYRFISVTRKSREIDMEVNFTKIQKGMLKSGKKIRRLKC